MSQAGSFSTGGGGGGDVVTLTGNNSGVHVPPDGSGNINFIGDGTTVTVTGNAGTHTLTISVIGSSSPNKTISDFDDFLSNGGANVFGKLGWSALEFNNVSQIDGTANNPGLVSLQAFSNQLGLLTLFTTNPNPANVWALGGGTLSMNFVFDIGSLSTPTNRYNITIGMTQQSGLDSLTDGCYFSYQDNINGGKWQINCTNSSTTTTADSGVLAATTMHNYGIQVNAAGTAVHFFIDGVETSNSPITTNIPTIAISPCIGVLSTAGLPPTQVVDLFYYTQVFTTAR